MVWGGNLTPRTYSFWRKSLIGKILPHWVRCMPLLRIISPFHYTWQVLLSFREQEVLVLFSDKKRTDKWFSEMNDEKKKAELINEEENSWPSFFARYKMLLDACVFHWACCPPFCFTSIRPSPVLMFSLFSTVPRSSQGLCIGRKLIEICASSYILEWFWDSNKLSLCVD